MRILTNIMLVLAMIWTTDAMAYRPPAKSKTPVQKDRTYGTSELHLRGGVCSPSESFAELSINNVRCRLLGGGDMWWDLDDGKYEVPKVDPASGLESVSSIFAGSVWIGGFDRSGSLKIAAIDYRNATTNEWWPGPIDEATGTTCKEDCDNWDRHFRVTGDEIRLHIANYERSLVDPTFSYGEDDIPSNIKYYPANGNKYFVERYNFELPNSRAGLGNFANSDEGDFDLYEPELGDYPQIDVRGCPDGIFADEMYFWVYNDVGNVHTNTQGDALQMEVQVQAFAYQTTDEINDMTFYRYKLINRSVDQLDSCFFAMWVDPDLGCYTDDYIGCDSTKSLMYIYNVDEVDGTSGCDCNGGVPTYCNNVPILGVDYFRGPLVPRVKDPITGELRNPKLGETADTIVEGGMSSFTYYNNGGIPGSDPAQSDPQVGPQYYNYLSGSWTDGTRFTSGGTGYNPGSTDYTNYALPDPPNLPGGWSMCEEGLENGDRRTIQATGPMRLDPNTRNELIIGVVWVPDQQYPCPDLTELFGADQKAQDLFDNCFRLPRGPDAPTVDIIELDQELILVLSNDPIRGSNNINESYEEIGLGIPPTTDDSTYVFEGYRIYQVNGPDVSRQELNDPTKSREVATIDLKNGITTIFNWEGVPNPFPSPDKQNIYYPIQQVEGLDGGVRHTIRITEDRFSRTSSSRLVNHRNYYFYAIAYGYNNFENFDTDRPSATQDEPYLEGRLNVGDFDRGGAPYIGVPRPLVYQQLNSAYGEGAEITRLDGIGVGGNFLDITEATENSILDGTFDGEIQYAPGRGPVDIRIYNPLEAVSGNYELRFYDDDMSDSELENPIRWVLNNDQGDTVIGDKSLDIFNEQVIKEFGFSVNIGQTDDAGDKEDATNGWIGQELEYSDPSKPFWFSAVNDGQVVQISFQQNTFPVPIEFIDNNPGSVANELDPEAGLSSGVVFPFLVTDYTQPDQRAVSPGWDDNGMGFVQNLGDLQDLNNVDIVFTSDKSKWSRCIVIETANDAQFTAGLLAINSAEDFDLRQSESVGKEDADGDGLADPDGDGVGMSWFPGYAVDVETGQRLNIFFGENSAYNQDLVDLYGVEFQNGRLNATDMMFNPSSQLIVPELIPVVGTNSTSLAYFGGHHYIYVTRQAYDGCAELRDDIETSRNVVSLARALEGAITWAVAPILSSGTSMLSYGEGLIPNDARLKVRVDNPYQHSVGSGGHNGYNFYTFSFDGVEPTPVDEKDVVEDAMDNIKAVPNPYYGFSEYEVSQFDNFIKITNVPDKATITIFGIDGSFIRQYKRDEEPGVTTGRVDPGVRRTQTNPAVIWDLKNSKGISVSSGTYLIHVVDEITGAEKTIKWFGVARKFDPSGL